MDNIMKVAVSAYRCLSKDQRREFATKVVEEEKKDEKLCSKEGNLGNCVFQTLCNGYFGCKYEQYCEHQLPKDYRIETWKITSKGTEEIKPTIEKLAKDFCNFKKKESEFNAILWDFLGKYGNSRTYNSTARTDLRLRFKQQIIDLAKSKVDELENISGFVIHELKQKLEEL